VAEPGTNKYSEIEVPFSLLRNFEPKSGKKEKEKRRKKKKRLPELVSFHKLHNLSMGLLAEAYQPKTVNGFRI